MSGESVTFSVFLKDYFSKELDKIGYKGGHAFTKLHSGFNNINSESSRAAGGVGKLNQNLDGLARERHVKINTSDIGKAHKELDKLEVARTRLEKPKAGGAGSGGAGMGLLTKAGIAGVAIGAAYKGFELAKDSVVKYNESEQVQAQLQAGLKSTGGISGKTMGGMTSQAESLQNTTLFDDEATKGAQSILLTFTQVRNEVFDQAIPAIQDLATKMKMDLPSAALQVGKALNDPIGGITALRRSGVQLTDQQEAQIKTFVKLGQVSKAQAIILKELNTEFGGSAAAAAKAGTGGLTILRNKFDDLKETIGARLMPTIGSLGSELGKVVTWAKQYTQVGLAENLRDERTHVEGLVAALRDQNIPAERRNELYQELILIAPDMSKALKGEKIDYEELNKQLLLYNGQMEKKITLASMKDISNKKLEESKQAYDEYEKRTTEIITTVGNIEEKLNKEGNTGTLKYVKQLREQLIAGKIDAFALGKSVLNLTGNIHGDKEKIWADAKDLERLLYGNSWSYQNLYNKNVGLSLPGLALKGNLALKEKNKAESEYDKMFKAYGFDKDNPTVILKKTPPEKTPNIEGNAISNIGNNAASVKQITINLDSLLRQDNVTNHFDSGQGPADAKSFLEQLTDALQMIVNDVNYSN
jgi:hypothetical protein